MRCPFCGALDTRVIDSRLASEGAQVRRRRECVVCTERFTTYEGAELALPRVVKRDGRRQPFSESKLRDGMLHALEKCPVGTDDIEAAVNRIKHKLFAAGEREISAKKIGDWVMAELLGLDQVAYVRFASVYRNFEDLRAFREVIDGLEQELTPEMLKNQLRLLKED